jgi:hypothetical protein
MGQALKEIINQHLKPGNYTYTFMNTGGYGSGIYLYLLTMEGRQFSKKMNLVR